MVGIESQAYSTDIGEIFGKCFLALLTGNFYIMLGIPHLNVMAKSRILQLLQGISLSYNVVVTHQRQDKDEYLFHFNSSFFIS